jgi:DNA polymerase-3 subunit gamma/tau
MIDEVHMLTNTAFNAMLKTLEEPPAYLKFVLATTDPQKVPATVLSRCLQFNLRPMAPETILEHLGTVLATEGVNAEPQALRLLARAARGSMRDALSLTDQAIAFGSGSLVEAGVRQMLGSVDRSYVYQLLDALASGNGKKIVETAEVLRVNGLNAASTLEEMTTILQRMAVLQAVPGLATADDPHDPDASEVARLAALLPDDETQLLYSLCLHGRAELGLAPDEYAALTMVLLRLLPFKRAAMNNESADSSASASLPVAGSAVEPGKKLPPPELAVPQPAIQSRAEPVPELAPVPVPVPVPQALVQPKPEPDALVRSGMDKAPEPSNAAMEPPAFEEFVQTSDSKLDDLWAGLVNQMMAQERIGALVRELALQSQLRTADSGVWTLVVEIKSLCQPAVCDKLLAALKAIEPAPMQVPDRLQLELGAVADTPARRMAAAKAERQRVAEESIQSDPFVQEMIRNWGARIVPGSIKPLAPEGIEPI